MASAPSVVRLPLGTWQRKMSDRWAPCTGNRQKYGNGSNFDVARVARVEWLHASAYRVQKTEILPSMRHDFVVTLLILITSSDIA